MSQGIQLIAGLGNPGPEYEATRHNAGFWWVDEVSASSASKLAMEARFSGHAGRMKAAAHEAWLLKPATFMNASGRAVGALARFYKIPPEAILVVHDELDLPPGEVKLKFGGGHGGHNGLKDIAAHLGTKDFWRLRLGIGHPGASLPNKGEAVINYVLHTPTKGEMQLIEQGMDQSMPLLPMLLNGEFEAAMLKLHTKK
jgi:PTH1 family peptidyl-tRNA hydrolase